MLFRSMTKPFDLVPKPTMSLLQRLTNHSAPSDAPPTSNDDSVYKFDFLQDVADIGYSSLPLVGDTTSTSVKPPTPDSNLKSSLPDRVPAVQPAAALPEHVLHDTLDPILQSLPRVQSFPTRRSSDLIGCRWCIRRCGMSSQSLKK